jgi:hypothetical protein
VLPVYGQDALLTGGKFLDPKGSGDGFRTDSN